MGLNLFSRTLPLERVKLFPKHHTGICNFSFLHPAYLPIIATSPTRFIRQHESGIFREGCMSMIGKSLTHYQKFHRALLIAAAFLPICLSYAVPQEEVQMTGPPVGNAGDSSRESDMLLQLRKDALRGDSQSRYYLGMTYLQGNGVPRDYNEAERWFLKAAEQGNPQAQFKLGLMYHHGDVTPPESTDAEKWLLKAAKKGDIRAQTHLGLMYYHGDGVPRNYEQGVKWFRKVADRGIPEGQFNLGLAYFQGNGVAREYKQAEIWFQKAADQGMASAQLNLGVMYLEGSGVSQDPVKAEKWLSMAADQGMASARYNLGMMYLKGIGVSQDYEKAEKWFRKAAETDDSRAQCMLGKMYIEGWGVAKDFTQAYTWLSLSLSRVTDEQSPFVKKATELRDSIVKQMTPPQIEEAQNSVSGRESIRKSPPKQISGSILKSKLIREVTPVYPVAAIMQRISGLVILNITIDENGDVGEIQVAGEAHPLLVDSAITAVKQWKYSPTVLDGNPIPVTATVTVNFGMGR
jgi:TonB family protein